MKKKPSDIWPAMCVYENGLRKERESSICTDYGRGLLFRARVAQNWKDTNLCPDKRPVAIPFVRTKKAFLDEPSVKPAFKFRIRNISFSFSSSSSSSSSSFFFFHSNLCVFPLSANRTETQRREQKSREESPTSLRHAQLLIKTVSSIHEDTNPAATTASLQFLPSPSSPPLQLQIDIFLLDFFVIRLFA